MPDAAILELLLRGGAVGAFLGLASVIAGGAVTPPRVSGVLFCLAAAAHTLTQIPAIDSALGPAYAPVWVFSVMGAGLFWTFATDLFGDGSRLRLVRFAPAALLLAIALAAALTAGAGATSLWLAHNLVGAAFLAHVLIVIWSGWRSDLVESRRRLRGPILAAAALYAVAVVAIQSVEILGRSAQALSPLAALALFGLGLAGVGALLRADPDLFAPAGELRAAGAPAREPQVEPPPALRAPEPSPEDVRIAEKLDRLMRDECAYREDGLSIAGLAAKLGVPEHKLRRLINQQLGYRNFNAFLNHWRLADAMAALADPGQRDVPISTIGLDAGFQSLGPFNRAFKAETGLTPSDFRLQALAREGAGRGSPGASG